MEPIRSYFFSMTDSKSFLNNCYRNYRGECGNLQYSMSENGMISSKNNIIFFSSFDDEGAAKCIDVAYYKNNILEAFVYFTTAEDDKELIDQMNIWSESISLNTLEAEIIKAIKHIGCIYEGIKTAQKKIKNKEQIQENRVLMDKIKIIYDISKGVGIIAHPTLWNKFDFVEKPEFFKNDISSLVSK